MSSTVPVHRTASFSLMIPEDSPLKGVRTSVEFTMRVRDPASPHLDSVFDIDVQDLTQEDLSLIKAHVDWLVGLVIGPPPSA